MTDYFALFGLPPSFDLDLAALEKTYYSLQRQYHPDRMANKPEAERLAALQQSMLINEAYQALRAPLTRAQHLLRNAGIAVNSEKDSVKPSQQLLMESLEMRERLSEISHPDDIKAFATETEERIEEVLTDMSDAFTDALRDKEYGVAAQATLRLGYLEKLRREIKLHSQKKSAAS